MSPSKSRLEIASLARSQAPAVLKMLIGIVMQEKSPPMARIAAGRELLDRGLGKALQKMTIDEERPPITSIVYRIVEPRPDVDTVEQQPGRRLPNWDYDRYGDPDEPGWDLPEPADGEVIDLLDKTDD